MPEGTAANYGAGFAPQLKLVWSTPEQLSDEVLAQRTYELFANWWESYPGPRDPEPNILPTAPNSLTIIFDNAHICHILYLSKHPIVYIKIAT